MCHRWTQYQQRRVNSTKAEKGRLLISRAFARRMREETDIRLVPHFPRLDASVELRGQCLCEPVNVAQIVGHGASVLVTAAPVRDAMEDLIDVDAALAEDRCGPVIASPIQLAPPTFDFAPIEPLANPGDAT